LVVLLASGVSVAAGGAHLPSDERLARPGGQCFDFFLVFVVDVAESLLPLDCVLYEGAVPLLPDDGLTSLLVAEPLELGDVLPEDDAPVVSEVRERLLSELPLEG
jgi:hypothetical protein